MVDTIFAQASARGQAGVAVVRISGPLALTAAADLAGGEIPPRRATVRWLRDPGSGERLDQAVVLAFPAPASFTGENVAELQVHGSQAVVSSLLAVLGRMPGLRPAEPGEFTRRALINERLDLAQVEGLADLLAAETAAQRRQALELMDGALSRKAADWGRRLTEALAFVEASIDFADEELPTDLLVAVRVGIGEVYAAMQQDLAGSRMAERIRDGFEVALVGRPNVGKSTLLNALAGREAALTSEIAGTTRDVIELRMELDGLAITLLDMAGLREASGRVEALGVERARARAARADLRVLLVGELAEADAIGIERRAGDLVVLAKADLRASDEGPAVSGATGAGIDGLLSAISTELGARSACAGSLSHQRQREAIERAAAAVANAGAELGRGEPRVELVAEDLRAALRALDFLVGKVDVEALLDVIFQSFCLGK
jgi:tRNA modification GTPase